MRNNCIDANRHIKILGLRTGAECLKSVYAGELRLFLQLLL